MSVLIESDWNLKERESKRFQRRAEVLIESDWNLKAVHELSSADHPLSY